MTPKPSEVPKTVAILNLTEGMLEEFNGLIHNVQNEVIERGNRIRKYKDQIDYLLKEGGQI